MNNIKLKRLDFLWKMVFIFLVFPMFSHCILVNPSQMKIALKKRPVTGMSISNIQVINHQIVVTGVSLSEINDFKIHEGSTTTPLQIESKTDTSIVANTLANFTFATDKVFDFILSSANGASTFQVTFAVTNNSITASMLTSMGATKGQIMKYNGSAWVPSSITNAQTYLGTWNATTNSPDLTNPSSVPGDYYIVGVAGTFETISYDVGDWIISDGYNWQKVANSAVVVSTFNGRRGVVTLTPADYPSLKSAGKITGSSINDFFDVNISGTPANDHVLKYDTSTSKWIAGAVPSGGGGVTSMTGTAPVVVTGTTTPVVSIQTASSGVAGALSNTAFDTFNNKLTSTLTSGQIFVGNGSNVATGVAVTGDVTITNGGVTSVGAAKITNGMLAGSIDLTTKVTGALPVANGGTGGSTAATARANLGLVIGTGTGELMTFTTSMSCFPYEKLQVSAAPYYLTCVTDNANTNYALLAGRASGQILRGGSAASENLTLDSTAHATKGYVLINPSGGNVGIGTSTPGARLEIAGGQATVAYYDAGTGATINFNNGNMQSSSAAAGTLTLDNMRAGGRYTLILTNATGGTYTLSPTGQTLRCQPECVSGNIIVNAGAHTVLSIVSTGSITYVSWMRGF